MINDQIIIGESEPIFMSEKNTNDLIWEIIFVIVRSVAVYGALSLTLIILIWILRFSELNLFKQGRGLG